MAIAFAFHENGRGRRATAGWILASGTVLSATLFLADLWREDVPGWNDVIAAAFAAAAVCGVGLIVRSGVPAYFAEYLSRDS